MPTFDWRKAAERFRAKRAAKTTRPEEDEDDDDGPGPTSVATIGWLPFFNPKGFIQPQPV